MIAQAVLLLSADKSISIRVGAMSGGRVRNRAAMKPTAIALSRKFRKGCLAQGAGTRGESGRH